MSAAASARAGRRAMTLLELLVVLAIVAVTGLVIAPTLASRGKDAERRALRLRVIGLVREAQTESTARGVPIAAVYDARAGRLLAGEKGSVALPRGWRVEVNGRAIEASKEGADEGAGGASHELFTWSPGGLSSAAVWKVTNGRGDAIEVECDAIEGVRVK